MLGYVSAERPRFPEASGGWFWWGAKGPVPFVQVWRILFDRLTSVDGIHNLVWVFTGDADLVWYPGDEYPKDLRDPKTQMWDDLAQTLGSRKLLAISEFGGVPDVPAMQRLGEFWSYAVSWSGKERPRKNSHEDVKRIYLISGTTLPATSPVPENAGSDLALSQQGFVLHIFGLAHAHERGRCKAPSGLYQHLFQMAVMTEAMLKACA